MNKNPSSFTFLGALLLLCHVQMQALRDPRRPEDNSIPYILVSSSDPEYAKTWASLQSSYIPDKTEYRLKNSFLRLKPLIHGFNQEIFDAHYLPQGTIEFRNKSGCVSGSVLSDLAHELLEEVKVGQRRFTHFTILKDKDFNYKSLSGLLVLKYKDYPFVIKISIEHPHTMVQPFSKSFEANGIFISGGSLRHLSNFTRIPNLHRIKNMLCYNPFYLNTLDYPSKWFWKPDKIHDLQIVWHCNGEQQTIVLPSVYATISDFIATEAYQPQADLNRLAMKVASDTGFLIDPHSGNIVIEQGTHRYVLLDSEDFRLMVGLDHSMKATKYIGWFLELTSNSISTISLRTKERRLQQSLTF